MLGFFLVFLNNQTTLKYLTSHPSFQGRWLGNLIGMKMLNKNTVLTVVFWRLVHKNPSPLSPPGSFSPSKSAKTTKTPCWEREKVSLFWKCFKFYCQILDQISNYIRISTATVYVMRLRTFECTGMLRSNTIAIQLLKKENNLSLWTLWRS